jgi:hypothetical protein
MKVKEWNRENVAKGITETIDQLENDGTYS